MAKPPIDLVRRSAAHRHAHQVMLRAAAYRESAGGAAVGSSNNLLTESALDLTTEADEVLTTE